MKITFNINSYYLLHRYIKILNITILLLFTGSIYSYAAPANGDITKLNIKLEGVTLETILNKIENETDYHFFYKSEDLNEGETFNINIQDGTIFEILDAVLPKAELSYRIFDKYIAIGKSQDIFLSDNENNQPGEITGTVIDGSNGEPLPGVNITIEGTSTGVITDFEGNYNIQISNESAVLVFSFVGYITEKVSVSNQTKINIELIPDIKSLDEVVVIGYGTVKKSDLTGSVSSVNTKDLEKTSTVNIQSAIQGRASGIMVSSNSGAPGTEASIRVRGIGTVNNNNPIYVVDGMIIDNSDNRGEDEDNLAKGLNFLNPADIESVEILKDASAQAIYGSRGANGVILITTRKGAEGAPSITLNSTWGLTSVSNVAEVLDAKDYLDYLHSAYYNGYVRNGGDANIDPVNINETTQNAQDLYDAGYNTNWLDEIIRPAVSQNYNISIRGGAPSARYSASAGYLNEDGIIKKSNYERYSFRLNTDFNLGKHLVIGENLGIATSRTKGISEEATGPVAEAMLLDPLTPVLKPEGEVDENDENYEYNKYAASIIGATGNPVSTLSLTNKLNTNLSLVGNIFAELALFKDFKFRSSWGFNVANTDISDFDPVYYVSSVYQNTLSKVYLNTYRNNEWIWENTLSYNKTIKEHSISVLVGYTSEYSRYSFINAEKEGTASNADELRTFSAASDNPSIVGSYRTLSMLSYLGRVNYIYKDRYLITASFRRDGSSKFGDGHKWGIFPSFSLGWKLGSEPFFKELAGNVISSLKLRTGWGQIGNSSLPVYNAYVSQVGTDSDYRYLFDDVPNTGYYLTTIGVPDITWETTEQLNIGVDLGVLYNALTISADYYIKNTDDMLLQLSYPYYAGYPSDASPYSNAGSVSNKGFELVVNYKGKIGELAYNVSANGSIFKNEVTDLGPGQNPIISSNYANRTELHSSIGRFYGYVTDGIFQTEQEVQEYVSSNGVVLQPDAHAGDFRFKNLNNDDNIDANDETWIGSPLPKFIYGFSLDMTYKAFDFTAFFQGSQGNDIYNATLERMGTAAGEYNILKSVYENAWRGEGTSNNQPIMTTVDENDNYRTSDYFIEDGSYLRLKNVQLGYTLPESICSKIKVANVRVYIGGIDLLTFTKYSGNDPEVAQDATPTDGLGVDTFAPYPKTRKITFGFNVSF